MKYILLAVLIISAVSCKVAYIPSESVSARQESSYEMSVNVSVLASTDKEANLLCMTKVFENIFFIGTPNTINNLPMLEGAKSEYSSFFDSFITKGQYASFVTSNSDIDNIVVKKTPRTIRYNKRITVNVQSLKLYLTREGVVRKFGY